MAERGPFEFVRLAAPDAAAPEELEHLHPPVALIAGPHMKARGRPG